MSAASTTELSSADGASAEVHHNGAHVLSWRPAPGVVDRLFLSERTEMRNGVAIRGGIPVIFPQFAAEGPLPRHGFARTTPWTLDAAGPEENGDATASFHLMDSPATRAVWPAHFLAALAVRVGGDRLSVTLTVENTGTAEFSFTAALHTYLRVFHLADAQLEGLRGTRYRVSGDAGLLRLDDDDAIRFDGEIDRVYADAPHRLTLREPTRGVRVESAGFPDVVVWNPGAARAASLKDMAPGEEQYMVCVEAASVQAPIMLSPGGTWSASQTLTVIAGTSLPPTPR